MTTITIPSGATLKPGVHATYGDGTCALELVDVVDRRRRGERVTESDRLTDYPKCVCPVIAAFVRTWNDVLGDEDRNRLLLPLLPLLIDTAGSKALSARRRLLEGER